MIGRAARNIGGEVVMYADRLTDSMKAAIDETNRRRAYQEKYNRDNGIEPVTIVKGIRDINDRLRVVGEASGAGAAAPGHGRDLTEMAKNEVERLVRQMEAEMRQAARDLEFERAAAMRDEVQAIRLRVLEEDASAVVARAAERAAAPVPSGPAGERLAPARAGRVIKPARDIARRTRAAAGERGAGTGERRGPGGDDRDLDAIALEVTSVRVVQATDSDEAPAEGDVASDTASDWLPGIRDEHEDDGWTAKWLDRPTWDHTVTPNVIKRTGTRPPRRRR